MNQAGINKSRLLAVDDNSDSAELIARVASKCGYDARSMTDPSTLARVLDEWKPQVLTLDLCMPEEDGISVLSLLTQRILGHLRSLAVRTVVPKTAAACLGSRLNVADDLCKPVAKDATELIKQLASGEHSKARPQTASELRFG